MRATLIAGLAILCTAGSGYGQQTKVNPYARDQVAQTGARGSTAIDKLKRDFEKVCSTPIEQFVKPENCNTLVELIDLHKAIGETHRLAEQNRPLTELREQMKGLGATDLSMFANLHLFIDVYGRYKVAHYILENTGDAKVCQYLMSKQFVKDRALVLTYLEDPRQPK